MGGVIIISIILSSLQSTAGGQCSVSKTGNYWIGVNSIAPILSIASFMLITKRHPFLKMLYCHIVKNVRNKNKFTVSMI